MMLRKHAWIFLLLFLPLINYAAVKINRVRVRNNILYCSLKAYVHDAIDMSWILDQGIDLKVKYYISLYEVNPRWGGDSLVTNTTIYYHSKSDIINKGYEVTSSYATFKKEDWIASQKDLFTFLMKTPFVPVIPLNKLDKTKQYYLQLQISISSLELYPPLSLIYQLLGRWSYTSPKINDRIFSYDSLLED